MPEGPADMTENVNEIEKTTRASPRIKGDNSMAHCTVTLDPLIVSAVAQLTTDNYIVFQAFVDAVIERGYDVIGGAGVTSHNRIDVEWSEPAEDPDFLSAIFWLKLETETMHLRLDVHPHKILTLSKA